MNQVLVDYIKKARETGQSDEQIKENLLKSGWKEENISILTSKSPVATITSPKRTYNWYLLTAIIYSLIAFLTYASFLLPSGSVVQSTVVTLVVFGSIFGSQLNIACFLLNIAIYIIILVKKVEKEILILPGLYILYMVIRRIIFPIPMFVFLAGRGSLSMIVFPLLFYLIVLGIAVKLLRTRPQNIESINRDIKQPTNLNLILAELFYLFVGIFVPLTNITREILVQVIVPNPINISYSSIFFSLVIFLISTAVFLVYVKPPKKDMVYVAIIGISAVFIYCIFFISTALAPYINW